MSKPLSTVELPWRDWRDRGRPRPLSSFTWWWRWRRNVIVRFLSATFSSLAMVKRMKANWTMLAMIWVCKKVKSIWRRVWINSQRCSETINNANMPTLLVKRPDRRSTRCALRWRSCMGGSRPQRQCLGGFSVSVWHHIGHWMIDMLSEHCSPRWWFFSLTLIIECSVAHPDVWAWEGVWWAEPSCQRSPQGAQRRPAKRGQPGWRDMRWQTCEWTLWWGPGAVMGCRALWWRGPTSSPSSPQTPEEKRIKKDIALMDQFSPGLSTWHPPRPWRCSCPGGVSAQACTEEDVGTLCCMRLSLATPPM